MEGTVNDSGRVFVEPLYQVKVWLKRKAALVTALEKLILEIKDCRIPELITKRPTRRPTQPRRSLEVCIMDPHIGLMCQPPQSDAPWDMEIAAGMIVQAIDDLVERAKSFGPFEQIFMPFGNDFVHCDTVFHETTQGTGQPEAISWHHTYDVAQRIAINMINRLRSIAPKVYIYEVPGNHSRQTDFTLARLLWAYFDKDDPEADVKVDASSSPYKFHHFGVNLIGFEHGHSVKPIRLAALMANECREIWNETEYREFHLGDQHRKGSMRPTILEEQGVSVEYIPGIVAPNEWHRLKSFSHQKRGAMAFVYDYHAGPLARLQFNISQYTHKPLCHTSNSRSARSRKT